MKQKLYITPELVVFRFSDAEDVTLNTSGVGDLTTTGGGNPVDPAPSIVTGLDTGDYANDNDTKYPDKWNP